MGDGGGQGLKNRTKRVDANQKVIVEAFRGAGASVKIVNQVRGFVDIIVGYRGQDQQVEVKDPSKPPSARKLTRDEADHWLNWRGKCPVIVETIEDVERILQDMSQ